MQTNLKEIKPILHSPKQSSSSSEDFPEPSQLKLIPAPQPKLSFQKFNSPYLSKNLFDAFQASMGYDDNDSEEQQHQQTIIDQDCRTRKRRKSGRNERALSRSSRNSRSSRKIDKSNFDPMEVARERCRNRMNRLDKNNHDMSFLEILDMLGDGSDRDFKYSFFKVRWRNFVLSIFDTLPILKTPVPSRYNQKKSTTIKRKVKSTEGDNLRSCKIHGMIMLRLLTHVVTSFQSYKPLFIPKFHSLNNSTFI